MPINPLPVKDMLLFSNGSDPTLPLQQICPPPHRVLRSVQLRLEPTDNVLREHSAKKPACLWIARIVLLSSNILLFRHLLALSTALF